MQIRTASGYTPSAPGNSSASAKAFVAEELSPIQSLGAPTQFEKSGLGRGTTTMQEPLVQYAAADPGTGPTSGEVSQPGSDGVVPAQQFALTLDIGQLSP